MVASNAINRDLLRFWDPHKGFHPPGRRHRPARLLNDLRHRIAIVQQDNYLFFLDPRRTCASASRTPPT